MLLPDVHSLYTLTGEGAVEVAISAGEGMAASRANVHLLRVDLDAATSKKLDLAFTPASLNRLPDGSSVLVRDTTGAVHLISPAADQVVASVAAVAR